MCSEVNCFRSDLRLKDRRHRLRFPWKTTFHPAELRRVERWQLHHRQTHTAIIVEKLAAKRIGEALNCVLCRTIGRLQRNTAIREGAAHLHDDATIARQHSFQRSESAVNVTEVSHFGHAPKFLWCH